MKRLNLLLISFFIFLTACSSLQSGSKNPPPDLQCQDGDEKVISALVNPKSYYPESPLMVGQDLYYVEYSKHRVMKWDGTNNYEFWKLEGCGPSAIALDAEEFLVTCYDNNSLVRISKDAITQKTYPTDKGPNDFAKDNHGGFYFSTSGVFDLKSPVEGKIYYLNSSGAISKMAENLHYPNGMAVVGKGKFLLVSEHLKNRIVKYEIQLDGKLKAAKDFVFADLSKIENPAPDLSKGLLGPDGMRLGTDGVLYVAQYGGSRILKFKLQSDGKSELLGQIQFTTAFPNTDNVWVTAGGSLYGSAVQEGGAPDYPGIIYKIQDLDLSGRKLLKCSIH